ncbi:MAG: neutral/alkaline non-lysosomal ceramidase N-terminal domain-containing protein [Myxococcaceae bacterium]|nr:neutral/alkaline non-lysosomal ceramidase N-terminal domain-containing protein [Myxococcaceae bacterium]
MAMRRRHLRSLLPFALLTAGAAYALASWNWCGQWEESAPVLRAQVRAEGPLRAGAAKVALQPPFPVVVAGYPPPRPEASQATPALHARAVVLQAGEARVGLVSLELLSVTAPMVEQIRARASALGLRSVLVFATHTHSSFGGYDARVVAQLVGTGRYRDTAMAAAVSAASEALRQASSSLTDVTLEVGEAGEAGFVFSRSGGEAPDGALTRTILRGATGPVAELLVFAAHPTLVPRKREYVDPDYPGRLSELREAQGGVVLLLQGAVGNASVAFNEGQGVERAAAFAQALSGLADRASPTALPGTTRLALAHAEVALPRPDASRLVPSLTRAAGDNFLCQSASRVAEVSALALGPLELLTLPGEPTTGAGLALIRRTGATRVLGLSGDYLGYVETPELVAQSTGESKRQYYGPTLLDRLGAAAQLASEAAGFTREP